jgi:hypothetical protein
MVDVRKLKDPHPNWNAVVEACPWGSFYHSSVYLELLEKMTGSKVEFLVAETATGLVGGLAFAVKEGPLGKVVNCLPYFGSYGEAIAVTEAPPKTLDCLYKSLLEECRTMNALSLTVITSPFAASGHHQMIRGIIKPTFVDNRNCQITYLPEPKGLEEQDYRERVISIFQPRVRTSVRKAERFGFTLAKAEREEEVLELHHQHTMAITSKGGSTKSEDFFKYAFALSLNAPNKASMALLKDDEKIAAGLVYLRHRNTVEYYVPVTNPEYFKVGPLRLLVFEVMVTAGLQGVEIFNFGGTWQSQKGVYQFKRGFGARDIPYEYYTVFFRDLEAIKRLNPEEILNAYPNFFVIPFDEL